MKPRTKTIGNHLASKELAKLFRHPDSGHPLPHSIKGYRQEIQNIVDHLEKKYPDDKSKQVSIQIIDYYVTGERIPKINTVKKIMDAYEDLSGLKINYEEWFIDKQKYLNLTTLCSEQKKICRNISGVQNKSILRAILGLINAHIPGEPGGVKKEQELVE